MADTKTGAHSFQGSHFAVVRLEDIREIDQIKSEFVDLYQPANAHELLAVERIALAQQSMLRCSRLEAGMYTASLNEALDPENHALRLLNAEFAQNIDITVQQNRNYCLADGLMQLLKTSTGWQFFLRLQNQAERHYRHAVEDLDRLQARRAKLTKPPAPHRQAAATSDSPVSSDQPLPAECAVPHQAQSSSPVHPPRRRPRREPASEESVPAPSNRSAEASRSPSTNPTQAFPTPHG